MLVALLMQSGCNPGATGIEIVEIIENIEPRYPNCGSVIWVLHIDEDLTGYF